MNSSYPLIQGLLEDHSMATEFNAYGIMQPQQTNQTLFSWRSLSERGFHFLKKYVLFYLAENQVQGLATAEFSHQIPEDRFELLVGYIE